MYNLNIIDSHSYILFFNSLKSLVRILLGKKYKRFNLNEKLTKAKFNFDSN